MPETFGSAFLSGLGHPVIGMDHLVAVLLVGFVSFIVTRRLLDPMLFAMSSLLGVLLHVNFGAFPGVELAVAITLPALLALSWFSQRFAAHSRKLMVVGGILHGFAYGESILGVGNTQVVAYLLGLAIIQAVLSYSFGAWSKALADKSPKAFANFENIVSAVASGTALVFIVASLR